MSQDLAKAGFPFLTRDMLSFEHGVTFSLQIISHANFARKITIRGMTREGVFTFSHTTDNTGDSKTESFRIPDFPIMVSASNVDGTFSQGDCYVSLGVLVNDDLVNELVSGFIYESKGVSYPVFNGPDQMPGGGKISEVSSANPAAGSEISFTTGVRRWTRIICGSLTLVAAAVAASRRVHLQIQMPNAVVLDFFSSVDQIVSETRKYTFANVGSGLDEADDNDIIIPIPANLWLPSETVIVTSTTNLNAADNFGTLDLLIEEFYDSG